MVAADRQRDDPAFDQAGDKGLDVLVAGREVVAATQWNVANVGHGEFRQRRHAQDVLVRPDPLDVAHGARPEAGARTIGDAEIHRHAQKREVDFAALRRGEVGAVRRAQQRRNAGVRRRPLAGALEQRVGDGAKMRIEDSRIGRVAVLGAQTLQLLTINHRCVSLPV